MIDKNEIIRNIAEISKIFVSHDDPILGVFAVNDVILEEGAKNAAGLLQKQNEDLVCSIRGIMEQHQDWIKQENESSSKYHGQIVRDAQIRFDRSIDETIDTIKKWHGEVAQMKSSTWLAALVTIVVMVLGWVATVAINFSH